MGLRLTLARWYYNYAWGWVIGYFLSTFTMIVTIYYLIPGLRDLIPFPLFLGGSGIFLVGGGWVLGKVLVKRFKIQPIENYISSEVNPFTNAELTGCKVPIQMAAIGSLARPPLAAAVSNAGGLGMIQLSGFTPAQATRSLEEVRKRTRNAFGANFIVTEAWYPDLEELREVVETASKVARVVEFFYRQPDSSLVELVHKNGALASWQVGSNAEAVTAAEAGCDLIVAQGIEAGGHIRGKIGLLVLLEQVLDSVHVPVLAAGGIGSGRAMAAALAAGAAGVRVGTRFIVAEEAEAHPQYQKALIYAEPEDTVVTEVF